MTETKEPVSLVDYGSLKDEPGSKPWCIAVRDRMRIALNNRDCSAKTFEEFQRVFIEHRGWEKLTDRKKHRFMSYEAFCLADPPHGLGYDLDAIDRIVAERKSAESLAAKTEPLAKHGNQPGENNSRAKAKQAEREQVDRVGDTKSVSGNGTTAEYLTARIARDAPEVLQRMKAGEFKSVRAAAKAAGIVKEATPIEKAKKAFLKLNEIERRAFLDWIEHDLDAEP